MHLCSLKIFSMSGLHRRSAYRSSRETLACSCMGKLQRSPISFLPIKSHDIMGVCCVEDTHLNEFHPVSPVTSQFLHAPARALALGQDSVWAWISPLTLSIGTRAAENSERCIS